MSTKPHPQSLCAPHYEQWAGPTLLGDVLSLLSGVKGGSHKAQQHCRQDGSWGPSQL
jgi:hypothetical protein